jgi:transcriptional regulator with XRE-family HTH domain
MAIGATVGRARKPRPADPNGRLAERVESLRKARQWSAAELADKAALGKGTVIRLEQAHGSATLDTIVAVARALGVTLAELVAESHAE